MVNVVKQVKEVLSTVLDERNTDIFAKFSPGMSYRISNDSKDNFVIFPYNENRFDFFKEYFQVSVQVINQQYTIKKMKRIKEKMRLGNQFFIRWYTENSKTVDDFEYVRIVEIKKAWFGIMKVVLSNDRIVTNLFLEKMVRKAFDKYDDWVVYEEINFLKPQIKTQIDLEDLYLKRLHNQMWCISESKALKAMNPDALLHIDESFIEQRKYIFSIIRHLKGYKAGYEKYIKEIISTYLLQDIAWKDIFKCFSLEYRLLSWMCEKGDA